MSEIEKIYENVGVEKDLYCCDGSCGEPTKRCKDCPDYREIYLPFTAEKQIELIKWLCQHTYRNYIKFRFDICGLWYCECNMSNSDMHHTFEDALIDVLMQIWQDLTEEEKQQVKGILE